MTRAMCHDAGITLDEEPAETEAETTPTLAYAPYTEFSVCVEKDGAHGRMGFELDTVGGIVAMVMRITRGAVELYNKEASSDAQIRVGDIVVAVNGVSGSTKSMRNATKLGMQLDLVVRRPTKCYMSLDRKGNCSSLGLEIDYLRSGHSLIVTSINAGMVKEWNRENPGKEMKVNDRIVEMNGVRGDNDTFLQIFKDSSHIDLVFVRA